MPLGGSAREDDRDRRNSIYHEARAARVNAVHASRVIRPRVGGGERPIPGESPPASRCLPRDERRVELVGEATATSATMIALAAYTPSQVLPARLALRVARRLDRAACGILASRTRPRSLVSPARRVTTGIRDGNEARRDVTS